MMMVRAKAAGKSAGVWIQEFCRDYRTTSIVLLVVGVAVLVLLLWLLGVFGGRSDKVGDFFAGPEAEQSIADGIDKSQVGKTLRSYGDRINQLTDKVKENTTAIQTNKTAIDNLSSSQSKLQRRTISVDELIKQIDQRFKAPELKPLSQLEGGGLNFRPGLA